MTNGPCPQIPLELLLWLQQHAPQHTPHPDETLADIMWNGGYRSLVDKLQELYDEQQVASAEGIPPGVEEPEVMGGGLLAHVGLSE